MSEETTTLVIDGKKEVFPKSEQLPDNGVDIFSYLVESGTTVPPWWSKRRDIELRKFWHSNDHVAGAFYAFVSRMTSVPIRVVAKDQSVKAHVDQAEEYTRVLWYDTLSRSDMTAVGWVHGWGMFLQDLLTQDNGAFFIVEGPGKPDGPLTGRPTKLIHLDSARVTRKADPEYPIVYENFDGKLYKIHASRVLAMSSMPSTRQRMYGVGFSALSRCINYAQVLTDILIYKQEKLGSRPKERLIIGKKGITTDDIAKAFYVADEQMNAMGLQRYSKTVVLAPNVRSSSAEIDLSVEDLVQAGQVFDEGQSMMLGMNTIALALGVPTRWLWPATATGATKADAEFQHLAGMVQGPGEIIRSIKLALEAKFLPPHLEISVDYQDDAQDEQQARIRNQRSTQRKTDIEDGVITVRVAREQALNSGDITQAQFDQMELDDGRLPSGDPIISLFNTKDSYIASLINLGVDNPLNIDVQDPYDMIIKLDDAAFIAIEQTQRAPSFQMQSKARTALAALAALKEVYVQRATDMMTQEVVEEINLEAGSRTEAGVLPEEPIEEPAAEEPTEEQKAYNFDAGGGEIIGGNLARDPEGKFISKDELGAAIRARLLERLRGLRGEDDDSPEAIEANREKVLGVISKYFPNFPVGGMDGLGLLGQGIAPDAATAEALVGQGLAKRNDDGSVQLSSQGASFLIAANKGDSSGAAQALIRAQAAKKAPAAPKGGSGGGSEKEPKKTPEEKEEEARQEAADNRAKMVDAINDPDITAELVESLNDFFEGADLEDQEMIQALSRLGFIQFDNLGQIRLARDGRAFITAMNEAKLRQAKDALSRGRESVAQITDDIPEPDEDGTTGYQNPSKPVAPAPYKKSFREKLRDVLNA